MKKKNRKGFSLVEVLVVMSIMMVLGAVAGLSISIVNNSNVSKAAKSLDSYFNDARIQGMARGTSNGMLRLQVANGGQLYGYIGTPAPAALDDWEKLTGSAVKVGYKAYATGTNIEALATSCPELNDGDHHEITFAPSGRAQSASGTDLTQIQVYTFTKGKRVCMFYFYPETGKHGTRIYNLP
ncbi:MAG: prepilin-type N-terminal cleavage/methylation domain-containing protein [Lachnospiraceae bacterium]|nr:prepilin-type N-terminal cleavage/methylation domain-containing protein [Lachnospiraceae bacterium]